MPSILEDKFVSHWENSPYGVAIPFVREYRFAAHHVGSGPGVRTRLAEAGLRDWCFDIAFLAQRVACEINGAIYTKGRHMRPSGYMDDCEKLRDAAKLGWRVLTFPGPVVQKNPTRCVEDLASALGIMSLN